MITGKNILVALLIFSSCRHGEIDERKENDDDMIFVKGGTFTMGCTSGQESDCSKTEMPAHQVTLSDFYIGKYEVTQREWFEVTGDNPSYFSGDDLPVERVSWNDIVGTGGESEVIDGITYYSDGFIFKLNRRTGRTYRLPTEAEWEYAARGGAGSRGYEYSGGNNVDDVAWYWYNSDDRTHPPGTKSANELGIYDMSGNVWEWCSDWYGPYSASAQTNPKGLPSGSCRVIRGGSWVIVEECARVSYRTDYYSFLGNSYNFLGFRLAADTY
ncbi:MAG: formylglycine-generating enzyme family protein [Tannerella sp.]|jgi:formylglycine-generating enzyme required for sulfatase activity|nr:formylglycine-generating enzyme family protein [Tannerella sp.]